MLILAIFRLTFEKTYEILNFRRQFMITLQDMRNGLKSGYKIEHEEVIYVPCFLDDEGNLFYELGIASHDEQMAYSFNPFYVLTLTGKFDCQIPAILDFYKFHGNGD